MPGIPLSYWFAPPDSMLDSGRCTSANVRVTWVDVCPGDAHMVRACKARAVGIPDGRATVCRIKTAGIMADSGANACMANSEDVLVECHNVQPVSVGLTIEDGKEEIVHYCTRMGYLMMN